MNSLVSTNNKMKKKIQNFQTKSKNPMKIVERVKIDTNSQIQDRSLDTPNTQIQDRSLDTPNSQIQDRSLSWLDMIPLTQKYRTAHFPGLV